MSDSPFLQRLDRATQYALSLMREGEQPAQANVRAARLYDVYIRDVARETGKIASQAKKKQQEKRTAERQLVLPI